MAEILDFRFSKQVLLKCNARPFRNPRQWQPRRHVCKRSLNADICLLYATSMLQVYQGRMIVRAPHRQKLPQLKAATALLGLGIGLAGCADMSDSMTMAFADPAKYDLYDCKQLETERKSLSTRAAELQGLMAKADTGVAGPVVAELAYRNDYVAVRGQARLADEAWQRDKCHDSPPGTAAPAVTPAPAADAKGTHSHQRSGNAVY
jgi:hypothetical protein